MSYEERFFSLIEVIKSEIPNFRIAYKDQSRDWKLRVANLVVGRFNKKFMTTYTTTLYPVVYFPSEEMLQGNYRRFFYTLGHEYVHLCDEHSRRVWFPISYVMPQVFAIFSLLAFLAFVNLWFLLFLLCLLFAFPVRSPWRTKWEMRGHSMNFCLRMWDGRKITEEVYEHNEKKFTGMDYYRMCPDSKKVRAKFEAIVDSVNDGTLLEGKEGLPFRQLKEIMDTIPS